MRTRTYASVLEVTPQSLRSVWSGLSLYEKARLMGLDERHIALAQAPITHVPDQQKAVFDAYRRVAIHALAYDNPGVPVVIDRYGIGLTPHEDGGSTLWMRLEGPLWR